MKIKPTLTHIKAQIRTLNIEKQKELLLFLQDEIDNVKTTEEANIDEYVEYVPEYFPEDDESVFIQGLYADFKSAGLKAHKPNKVSTKWFGNEVYEYGNTKHHPNPIDKEKYPFLKELLERAHNDPRCGSPNSSLMGIFPSAEACLKAHADNEENLDHTQPITVFSFGSDDRDVEFFPRSKHHNDTSDDGLLKRIRLANRSMYIMKPGCQQLFKHRVPQAKQQTGERFLFL